MKVIVIDDQNFNVQVLKQMLNLNGFDDVETFRDVDDLFNYLNLRNPAEAPQVDVILSDINMPKMNGINLCKTLKGYPHLKDVPVIMVTAYDDENTLKKAFDAGAFDYIRKPFKVTDLVVRMQSAINRNEMVAELKKKALSLEKHAEQYQSLFHNNLDAYFWCDLDGKVIDVNSKGLELVRLSHDDAIGSNVFNYLVGDGIKEKWLKYVLKDRSTRNQIQGVFADGTVELDLEVISIPLKKHDKIIGAVEVVKDITAEKRIEKSLEEDLALAKTLQQAILPPTFSNGKIEIIGKYMPSSRLSGDMYYWAQVDESRYGIILVDVMGHGVAPSLVSMSVRSLLHGLISRVTDPVVIMEELNKHAFNLFQGKSYYFTSLCVQVDLREQTIEYSNAGHPPAILFDGDQGMYELKVGGMPVGLVRGIGYEKEKLPIKEGSSIILYTDGLIELWGKTSDDCRNRIREEFIKANCSGKALLECIEREVENSPQDDDITAVSISIVPTKEKEHARY